jgi:molybdenum cofactor synthesis domain-containing protein
MERTLSDIQIKFGVLTISDRSSRGVREDLSGPALVESLESRGWKVIHKDIVPDDIKMIRETLIDWMDTKDIDVIVTTGGTGFSPRDVTPEATQQVIERPAPGLTEAMRAASLRITPHAMLSRAVAGIRGRTLIINFPGSPKAAIENLDVVAPVLPHAIRLLRSDPAAEAGHDAIM